MSRRKRSHKYQLLGPIPEIDGAVGDVLVWRHPQVYLVRPRLDFFEESFTVTPLRIMGAYWWFIFSKYENRLDPLDAEAPPVQELARLLPPHQPPRRSSSDQASVAAEIQSEAESILDWWPCPEDWPIRGPRLLK